MWLDLVVAICDIKGMDKLRAFVERQSNAPMRQAADALGVSRPYLYDLMSGKRQPSFNTALRIEKATAGEISVADWPNLARIAEAVRQ